MFPGWGSAWYTVDEDHPAVRGRDVLSQLPAVEAASGEPVEVRDFVPPMNPIVNIAATSGRPSEDGRSCHRQSCAPPARCCSPFGEIHSSAIIWLISG
jgi:hypothetical protein